MSIAVPLHGFGTGGNSLNYNVICSQAQPENPKKGTIWLKTSTPTTNVYLKDASAPYGSTNGSVVIQFEASSGTDKDNIYTIFKYKKSGISNSMRIKLLKAWQYFSSKWNSMDAYVYNAGAWYKFSSVFSATINITYPAGSTCTCSNGTTTLAAPNTSGTWACTVPNAGTWTATATDGNDSTNKSISITADGQTENVVLSYTLVLYEKNGETVDWSYKAYDYSVPSVNMTLDTLESQNGEGNARLPTLYTTVKHDISSYDTLYGSFDMTGSGSLYLGILSSPPTKGSSVENVGFVSYASKEANGKVNLTLDISNFTGEYHIAVYVKSNWGAKYNGSTIKIYAE